MASANASTKPMLRIASRGSPLALTQAKLVQAALARAHGWPQAELDALCPIVTVKTTGDKIQDRPLAEAGGKGLFVKEIEEALLQDAADIAVHSMKDVPGLLPNGLFIGAVLEREDPRDVLILRDAPQASDAKAALLALPKNARLGTSSVRRQALALRLRSDLQIVSLRGNVETRLAKLGHGDADAIILAAAGLHRLHLNPHHTLVLEEADWPSALCQGAIGVELRSGDTRAEKLVAPISHADTAAAIACERGFLAALDGSCRTPIAGLAAIRNGRLSFQGEVLTNDGGNFWAASRAIGWTEGGMDALKAAEAMGHDAADAIKAEAGALLPRF
jgi:hydroxymethylbilane synthase